jgi:uncharacterized SAM-binding protein YcdF (DUF218 family)
VATGLSIVAVELLHWRASRQAYAGGARPAPGSGTEAIVALGYPATRAGHLHPLQRWRTETAVRSMDPHRDSCIVFTGARGRNSVSEAAVMAAYARDGLGVPAERIRLETHAHNTWQNIELTLPMIETAEVIKIASDPMHAARARRYLLTMRPDLGARLSAADDYRFLERWYLKAPTAVYELALMARRRTPRGARPAPPPSGVLTPAAPRR